MGGTRLMGLASSSLLARMVLYGVAMLLNKCTEEQDLMLVGSLCLVL